MFYILDKGGRIVASVDRPVNLDDLASRGEQVVASDLALPPERLEVTGFPAAPVILERKAPPPSGDMRILLKTTAEDADGDGLPELRADGKSKATITATLQGPEGQLIQEAIEVHFRTSAGSLSQRRVTAQHGRATVQLTASRETVPATVYAFAEGIEHVSMELEFVPSDD